MVRVYVIISVESILFKVARTLPGVLQALPVLFLGLPVRELSIYAVILLMSFLIRVNASVNSPLFFKV